MTLEDYEKDRNGHTVEKINSKYFRNLIIRTLITTILVLTTLIVTNISNPSKAFIEKYLFKTDFKFSTINKIFNKYFLNKTKEKTKPVNLEKKLDFKNAEAYKDGVSLTLTKDSSVPLIESGIVVFIGEKENYKNTIIVQQSNGIDAWYGNIENIDVNLYDYIEKGKIIGTSNDKLYLVFQKNGEYLDYKEVIK